VAVVSDPATRIKEYVEIGCEIERISNAISDAFDPNDETSWAEACGRASVFADNLKHRIYGLIEMAEAEIRAKAEEY
jgi:hypothetical protein